LKSTVIYEVLCIPGGAGFLPSTVSLPDPFSMQMAWPHADNGSEGQKEQKKHVNAFSIH